MGYYGKGYYHRKKPRGGGVTVSQPSNPSSIYWGARMDGETYGRTVPPQGDAPWDPVTWDIFETNTGGKKVSLVSFGQPPPWDQAFSQTPFDNCRNRGAIPVCDMGTEDESLSGIASGSRDGVITTWMTAAKNYAKPFMLRLNWEMNGTWFGWGSQAVANPTHFIDSWRKFKDIADGVGATNITWVWCVNINFTGSPAISTFYPGDSYVDWMGIDGYNWGTNPNKPDSWKTFNTLYSSTYADLAAINATKPMMINEMGCTEFGGTKATWITDFFTQISSASYSRIKGFSWFNWNVTEGSGHMDWPIESSEAARAAFASAVSNERYAQNTFGSLPTLSKILPL